eukprot:TRINITY_DN2727_c0_g1_i3.p1 TRINITY_DN2727_c0_g1~~TRINITY_DN2727_c0_g1_i3.p1  ORF type:complete len:433 (+),score=119.53 TRINITY_DN2727_c0_g1_i3:80-1378(+)
MGPVASRARKLFAADADPHVKALMLGLDAAGKTTALWKVARGEVEMTIPAIGFNIENATAAGVALTAWDVGGRCKMRAILRHYIRRIDADACFFCIDSNDHDRIEDAIDELVALVYDFLDPDMPFVVLCNKQDLPNALSAAEIQKRFDKRAVRFGAARFIGTCATSGEGLEEAFDTLVGMVADKRAAVPARRGDDTDLRRAATGGDNAALRRFAPIRQRSECIFARHAVLWGGAATAPGAGLDAQAEANAAPLAAFSARSNAGEKLDGYCIEVDAAAARDGGVEEFGECVRALLTALSDRDPNGKAAMRQATVGNAGWRWQFGGADFFITAFAPCYPPTHSRYTHGVEAAFVLLQPEASFMRHGLPVDTPHTSWTAPRTVRDRIRVAFKEAGRAYHIPNMLFYPMVDHIVKPLHDDGSGALKWWREAAEPSR